MEESLVHIKVAQRLSFSLVPAQLPDPQSCCRGAEPQARRVYNFSFLVSLSEFHLASLTSVLLHQKQHENNDLLCCPIMHHTATCPTTASQAATDWWNYGSDVNRWNRWQKVWICHQQKERSALHVNMNILDGNNVRVQSTWPRLLSVSCFIFIWLGLVSVTLCFDWNGSSLLRVFIRLLSNQISSPVCSGSDLAIFTIPETFLC